MSHFHLHRTTLAALALAVSLGLCGCRRTEAEYQKLVQENSYLKTEIERLNRRGIEEKAEEKGGASAGQPDLAVTIVDLWSQRFDDNEFRARQRLSGKTIRLTGSVDAVAADQVGLAGESKRFGNVHVGVNLTSGYAIRIRDGLAALERGTTVTVQGKFNYERMILTDSSFVDQVSGRTLYADDLLSLSAGMPISAMRIPAATPTPAPKPTAPVATPAPK